MNEELGVLVAKLQADVTDLKKGLIDGRNDLKSFKGMAQEVGAQVKRALTFTGVAVGLYEILGRLKEFSREAAMIGARTESLSVAMYQVGKNAGVSAQTLDFYVDQLKKAGITTQEAMLGATKFMSAGLDLSKLAELATRARDIAVVANVNTSEAFSRVIQGVISGEQETLKRLLINVGNIDDLMKKWSETMGVNKDQIGAVTKANLLLNEVLEKTTRFAGAAAAADETVGKKLASLARYAEEAKNALWPIFQPAFLAWVQEMTRGYKDLESWAKANKDRLAEWGRTGAEWVRWLATGIRDIGSFIAENKELLKRLAELYIASKAAGWFMELGGSLKKTAAEVGIVAALLGRLKTLVGGPWRLAITITLLGFYEAWKKIQELRRQAPDWRADKGLAQNIQDSRARDRDRMSGEMDTANLNLADDARRRGLTVEKYQELLKEDQKWAIEGRYRKFTAPSRMPPVLPEYETPEERAAREAKEAREKAEKEQYIGKPKDKGGKSAQEEDLFGAYLKVLDQERQAEVQAAQDSLELLKSTNEKKKAELEKQLAEGLIDGQTYYARLQELQKEETDAALGLIEKKKAAQIQAHRDALADIDRQEISPEMAGYLRQQEEAKHRMVMAQLAAEAARVKLEGEKKVTEELKRQLEVQQQYKRQAEDLGIETGVLLGAISQQEAALQKLYLDWQRTKQEALKAGASPEFFQALEANYQAKKADTQFGGYASAITQGVSSLVDALMEGGQNLKQAAHNIFKSIFTEAMKPGLEQLKGLLVSGFKNLFGEVGTAVSSAIMGVIGLIGMLLTSGGGSSSWSPSGVTSGVTAHEAVRGIIAGPTSIPIAEIGESLQDALVPTNGILSQIEENTRGIKGLSLQLTIPGLEEALEKAFSGYLERYFENLLQTGGV
ncbi:MAG: hypothetical protein PHU44_00145 [Syntrophales bacterium]|nr:hypothetical protein [Syntrophales bacterium]MDD5640111.1 hypothetical protein [Syntrophales bacterium]